MKKIIDRLLDYIELKGISLNSFDKSIGLSNGYMGKQVKNRASIGGDILEKIFSIYNDLSVEWLITGKGNMLTEEEKPPGVAMEGKKHNEHPCEKCAVKDELIESQRQQIDTQKELIALLKERKERKEYKSPEEDGQKRKAS